MSGAGVARIHERDASPKCTARTFIRSPAVFALMLFTLPSRICAGVSACNPCRQLQFCTQADSGKGLTWPSHRFSASFNSLV